jgi:hypothetical protein
MNINITLKRIGIPKQQLLQLIRTLHNGPTEDHQHSSQAHLLDDSQLALLPNLQLERDELRGLQRVAKNTAGSPQLAPLESLLLDVNNIPNCAKRLACLATTSSWQARADDVLAALDALSAACAAIRACHGLKAVLTAALAMARTLAMTEESTGNGGKGASLAAAHVHGIRLSSLSALDRTKASDGRSTVLHFLESMASCLSPTAIPQLVAVARLRSVSVSARLPLSSVDYDVQALTAELQSTDEILRTSATQPTASLSVFYRTACQRTSTLKQSLANTRSHFDALLEYFGEAGGAQPSSPPASHVWVKGLVELTGKMQRMQADRVRWARRSKGKSSAVTASGMATAGAGRE